MQELLHKLSMHVVSQPPPKRLVLLLNRFTYVKTEAQKG